MDSPGKKNLTAAKYNDFIHIFTTTWSITNSSFKSEIRNRKNELVTSFIITKSDSDVILTIDSSVLNSLEIGTYNYDIKENEHRIIYGDFILREGITR